MTGKHEIILEFGRLKPEADFDVPVPVRVHFDEAETETFDFVNPLTDKDLSELRWYLESYWQWPSDIDDDRAREVEGNLPRWGKALMDAIIQKSADAMRLFGRFSEADGEHMLTIDTTEPRILRLPWELLRDEGGYLFSEKVSVRRRMHKIKPQDVKPFDLPVRILMVTCRPDGAGFIDPRSIATPLLDALDALPEHFEVEFLRPPTLKALDERLRDESKPRVHIVHFDGHGVYDKGIGLGFLLFEDEENQRDMVDAEQLGTLLNRSGIPLMVLNACQSAQPDDRNPFASVASRLIESGVGGVVAMNYSVLVETAKRFTKEFYGALARGGSANAAMDTARRTLFADTKRLSLPHPQKEEAIIVHLQDWFLPALYQQADELVPFKPDGQSIAPARKSLIPLQSKGERGGFPPPPLHGFHGRARELLDLERAFAARSIVVLHGFGGQGKTSLATQAAEWFTRTRLFERAAFLSFENGASLEYVLNELGNALVEENFQIHAGDKVEAIAKSLRERPSLVVFDNFESALPGGNAPMQELQALLDAVAKWFPHVERGTWYSALLITTRNPDIPHTAFTPGTNCQRRELDGLAASDALELAASILEAHSLPRPPRVPLENLLNFLRGHPLSLQLALPQLRTYSAGELVAEYQTILPNIKTGAAKERNESLEVSLRFSLDRLGEEAKTLLSRLWVFEGGAWEPNLLNVTEIPVSDWNALKPQLISIALIRQEEVLGVKVPFIHFHPTLPSYLRVSVKSDTSLVDILPIIQKKYCEIYCEFSRFLYNTDDENPIVVRALASRELPNLRHALDLSIKYYDLEWASYIAKGLNVFLSIFGLNHEKDKIIEQMMLINQGEKLSLSEITVTRNRAEQLRQSGKIGDAEILLRNLLSRLNLTHGFENEYFMTMLDLGRCLLNMGRLDESEQVYLDGFNQLKVYNEKDEHIEGMYLAELGDIYAAKDLYQKAEENYILASELFEKSGKERLKAAVFGNLGKLLMLKGDLFGAREVIEKSRMVFHSLGEPREEVVDLMNLGNISIKIGNFDDADKYFRESIHIIEILGDNYRLAASYGSIGSGLAMAGQHELAEKWFKKGIVVSESHNNSNLSAMLNDSLGSLLLKNNRLDEAEDYARRAVSIKETLDLSSEPWTTYSILAQIAEKRGNTDEARQWRRKEQESRMAFERQSGGQANTSRDIQDQADKWNPVIAEVVSTCRNGTAPSPELSQFLEKMAQTNDWRNLIAVIRRVLFGERGIELLDGLDFVDSAIVRRILQALEGGTVESERETVEDGLQPTINDPAWPPGQEQGVTLPQLLELVERAAEGDSQLGGQLFNAFQQMVRSGDDFNSKLGNVFLRVLVGDKNPNLDGLPDEVASAVRGLLGRLKNR